MRKLCPPQLKMVLGIPLSEYKPGKFPFFVTQLFCGRHDSTNFLEEVNFAVRGGILE
jgi:hypothetical protein